MNKFTAIGLLAAGLFAEASTAQNLISSDIKVKVRYAKVLSTADCDIATGDSDFAWHFIATDNTLGNSNNFPTDTDFMGAFNFGYRNGNNGPYTIMPGDGTADSGWDPSNGDFFRHSYCATDVPTQISVDWRAYENDATGDYSTTNSPDGNTGPQNLVIAVPAFSGATIETRTASGSSGSCPQTYEISFSVERIDYFGAIDTDATICQGDTLVWEGQAYTAAGDYDKTYTAQNGCDSTVTLHLAVNPLLTAGVSVASSTGDTACLGELVSFEATPSLAGSNPGYQWFLNGNNLGVISNNFATTALQDGDVIICVMTVDTVCAVDNVVTSADLTMQVETCTGIETTAQPTEWSVYPNPLRSVLVIEAPQTTAATLRLMTAMGQVLREEQATNFPLQWDLQVLPAGLYFIQLADEKGSSMVKVVKE